MKQTLLLLFLLGMQFTTYAQTFTPPAFADIDNNYRNYVNTVFGALETNRVPTGFLADYGFDFTDPKIYNGTVLVYSTLMEQGIFSDLYKTIFTSKFNSNAGTLLHPSLYDSICYIERQNRIITLSKKDNLHIHYVILFRKEYSSNNCISQFSKLSCSSIKTSK